jgi:hypothetical protein
MVGPYNRDRVRGSLRAPLRHGLINMICPLDNPVPHPHNVPSR